MNNGLITPAAHGITRRAGLLTLLGSALALAGCGGGGSDVAGLSSGGTGSFSVGPITGFGSVIVNGVRFDDSSASVSDDDGGLHERSELKLGMMVVVTGSAVTGTSATASSIVFGGELQGPISAISASPQTLTVLGQTVTITGSTFFDISMSGGFASLAVNDIVEVHGVVNPFDNTIQATFIEKKNSPSVYKIQGLVKNHNAGSSTFSIGSGASAIQISYANLSTDDVRVTLGNDVLVRVRLQAITPPLAVWTATRIRPPEDANEDHDEAEIEGSITAFTSTTRFSVNGIEVNADLARFDDGPVALGMRVEVKGRLSGGVLIAERVEIEDDNEIDDLEFELHGTATNVTATSFTLTSSGGLVVSVTYSSALISNLLEGSRVEVRGTAFNATNASTVIVATQISFESSN